MRLLLFWLLAALTFSTCGSTAPGERDAGTGGGTGGGSSDDAGSTTDAGTTSDAGPMTCDVRASFSDARCGECLTNHCCEDSAACFAEAECTQCLYEGGGVCDVSSVYERFHGCANDQCFVECLAMEPACPESTKEAFGPGVCSDCLLTECCGEATTCLDESSCVSCLSAGDAGTCAQSSAFGPFQICASQFCFDACKPQPVDAGSVVDAGSGHDAGADAGMLCGALTVPAVGSCVSISIDAGVTCNPVTNGGCDGDEACDVIDGGTKCFPPPNVVPVCGACDSDLGPYCGPGTACVEGTCVRFCCDALDCPPDTHCAPGSSSGPLSALGWCVR